jgi:hypothetical protein
MQTTAVAGDTSSVDSPINARENTNLIAASEGGTANLAGRRCTSGAKLWWIMLGFVAGNR